MQLNDLKKILATSSQDEWIVDDETGSFTYKNDLNLRIERAEYEQRSRTRLSGKIILIYFMSSVNV